MIIRGAQHAWEEKFDAVEWLARYMEYLGEDVILTASVLWNDLLEKDEKDNGLDVEK